MSIFADTGLGTCILMLIAMVGIPLALWIDGKRDEQ